MSRRIKIEQGDTVSLSNIKRNWHNDFVVINSYATGGYFNESAAELKLKKIRVLLTEKTYRIYGIPYTFQRAKYSREDGNREKYTPNHKNKSGIYNI